MGNPWGPWLGHVVPQGRVGTMTMGWGRGGSLLELRHIVYIYSAGMATGRSPTLEQALTGALGPQGSKIARVPIGGPKGPLGSPKGPLGAPKGPLGPPRGPRGHVLKTSV